MKCVTQFVRMHRLAFPNDLALPAERLQLGGYASVALAICIEFAQPEVYSSLRRRGLPTAFVAVPEASVDEKRNLPPRKDQIRRSW